MSEGVFFAARFSLYCALRTILTCIKLHSRHFARFWRKKLVPYTAVKCWIWPVNQADDLRPGKAKTAEIWEEYGCKSSTRLTKKYGTNTAIYGPIRREDSRWHWSYNALHGPLNLSPRKLSMTIDIKIVTIPIVNVFQFRGLRWKLELIPLETGEKS